MRDADGEPTGIVIDNAMDLVRAHVPDPSADQIDERFFCLGVELVGSDYGRWSCKQYGSDGANRH